MKRRIIFGIVFSRKNDQKFIQKVIKTQIDRKTDKRMVLGTVLEGKNQVFRDFGVPGRPLGKALGRILERKIGDQKKVEKNKVEGMTSEGYARAGREG